MPNTGETVHVSGTPYTVLQVAGPNQSIVMEEESYDLLIFDSDGYVFPMKREDLD